MVRLLIFALLLGYLQSELSLSTTSSITKGTTQNETNVEILTEDTIESETTDFDPTESEPPVVQSKPQYEVNMNRCFKISAICYVGVNCLINGKGRHGRIVRVNNSISYFAPQRKRIEECNVAAILVISHKFPSLAFEDSIVELSCDFGCSWTNRTSENNFVSSELYATGKVIFDSSIKRANLGDCFKFNESKLKCFIGDGCLEDVKTPHTKIIRFTDNDRIDTKYNNSNARKSIQNCDVGATLKSTKIKGEFRMEYHTNTSNLMLPIRFDFNSSATQILRARNRKLSCSPNCAFYLENMINTDYLFWSGKLNLFNENRHIDSSEKSVRRANLSSCFEEKRTVCYIGDKCIEGNDGKHVKIGKKHRNHFKNHPTDREKIEKCSVGAVFRPVEVKGFYEFEYHTTIQSLGLSIAVTDTAVVRIVRIENGRIVCEPHCQYGDAYDSIAQESREEIRGLFWAGTFQFKYSIDAPKKITSLPRAHKLYNDPIPLPLEKGKESEKGEQANYANNHVENVDDRKNSLSLLGLILIICGCVLVVGIIAAVIIGTIIQHRHNAKNKLKRAALEKATARAAKNSESSSDERVKAPLVEETSLIEGTPLGEDDPCSEVTTSTKFSVGEIENSAASAMLYG